MQLIALIYFLNHQVASALGYLHSQQIIYRDLKSENVLVWSFPAPDLQTYGNAVDVKLADYGVSRVVLPSGTKGFAGTPSFMAPEIIQHNGEEPYTEKVFIDMSSFYLLLFCSGFLKKLIKCFYKLVDTNLF